MRKDFLTYGIVLVIIGIFFYFVGNNMVEQSPWTMLESGYEAYQTSKSTGNILMMLGAIFSIVGFILCLAGIFIQQEKDVEILQPDEKASVVPQKQKTIPSKDTNIEQKDRKTKDTKGGDIKKFCFHCGTKLEGNPKYCGECGTKLR